MLGKLLIIAVLVFGFAGCTVKPADYSSLNTELSVPASFRYGVSETPHNTAAPWWHIYNDEHLGRLIDHMFKYNYELDNTYKSLEISRLGLKTAKADRLPEANLGAGAGSSSSGEGSYGRDWKKQYELSAKASWEIDLWGAQSASVSSAEYSVFIAGGNVRSKYISLSAEMADRYFLYLYETERLKKLSVLKELYEKQSELDMYYFRKGLGELEDVYDSEKELESTVISIEESKANLKGLKEDMALLSGMTTSDKLELPDGWSVMLPPVPAAVPAEVLKNRPDVMSALYEIYKSDRELAFAAADMYPSLTVSGSAAFAENSVTSLVTPEAFAVSVMADMLFTVFDGGKKRNTPLIRTIELEQSISSYKQTVISSLNDVENSFITCAYTERNLEETRKTLEKDKKMNELQQMRFRGGLKHYRDVLLSEINLIEQETDVMKAEKDYISAGIGLIRALGGGWETAYLNERVKNSPERK
jgi:NodT family efflux transporter outer membrane factor (OMF) lipoprotein